MERKEEPQSHTQYIYSSISLLPKSIISLNFILLGGLSMSSPLPKVSTLEQKAKGPAATQYSRQSPKLPKTGGDC